MGLDDEPLWAGTEAAGRPEEGGRSGLTMFAAES